MDSGLPPPELFPTLLAGPIAGKMPKGWVHRCLESGRAIVLVDGVDEAPQHQRSDVRAWLREMSDTYPAAR